MSFVVDVSVFIDRLFTYDNARSNRAHEVFRLISEYGINIFEPQVFGIELISQLIRRKPRNMARKIYSHIIN